MSDKPGANSSDATQQSGNSTQKANPLAEQWLDLQRGPLAAPIHAADVGGKQIFGSWGSGKLGGLATAGVIGLGRFAVVAVAAGTAPEWAPVVGIGALVVGVGSGLAVTIGSNNAWNRFTKTGEQDWHNSWGYDSFNYVTFGSAPCLKYGGELALSTKVGKEVVDAVAPHAKQLVELGKGAVSSIEKTLGNVVKRTPWAGKIAKEEAEEMAKGRAAQVYERAARANRAAATQEKKQALKKLEDTAKQKNVPQNKIAECKTNVAKKMDELAKAQAKAEKPKLLEAAYKKQLEKQALASAKVAQQVKDAEHTAKILAKAAGHSVNDGSKLLKYAGNVAKTTPFAASYSYGQYLKAKSFDHKSENEARWEGAGDFLFGTFGGAGVRSAGNWLAEKAVGKFVGKAVEATGNAGVSFADAGTRFMENVPLLRILRLGTQAAYEGAKDYPFLGQANNVAGAMFMEKVPGAFFGNGMSMPNFGNGDGMSTDADDDTTTSAPADKTGAANDNTSKCFKINLGDGSGMNTGADTTNTTGSAGSTTDTTQSTPTTTDQNATSSQNNDLPNDRGVDLNAPVPQPQGSDNSSSTQTGATNAADVQPSTSTVSSPDVQTQATVNTTTSAAPPAQPKEDPVWSTLGDPTSK